MISSSGPGESRCYGWLIAARYPLLLIALILTALAWVPAGRLRFDRTIEKMFSPNDPLLVPYGLLKRTFGGDETVLATYTDPQLLSQAGMQRLEDLEQQIKATPRVAAVLSLLSPMGRQIIEPGNASADRLRALFEGYTHGADGRTSSLVVLLEPAGQGGFSRDETVARLRRIIGRMPDGSLCGEPVMVADGFRYLEEDGRRLGTMSTILLTATIAFCFRSARWVLIPLAVVQWTLLMTRALLVVLGFRLSMVSSMLSAIVTVVGVAAVIHVIVRFREARDASLDRRDALIRAAGLLAVPVVWASTTDAAGFASLLAADVGPVRDFGVMTAVGSLLVVLSIALLVPGLALVGRVDPDPRWVWGEGRLESGLRRSLGPVERRPRTLAAIALIATGVTACGLTWTRVETDFTRNFRRDSPIVRAYTMIESRLGGAAVWDVVVPAPRAIDWKYLARVLRMEDQLRAEVKGLTKVISLADLVQAGAPIDLTRSRSSLIRRTVTAASLGRIRARMPTFFRAVYAEDPMSPGHYYLRVMLRCHERQTAAERQALIRAVARIARRHFPQAEVTGLFVLLTSLVESMVRDQWTTFSLAVASIALMMTVAFRSLRLALFALLPNALPIVMVSGMMGWLGLKINMGAAMIAAVSMGLSIDSSIHYIAAYRRARRDGIAPADLLDGVQQTVGRAVIFSTLALIVGFSSLCFSHFVPTITFGVLVSLSMLGGLVGNLIILPLLLRHLGR